MLSSQVCITQKDRMNYLPFSLKIVQLNLEKKLQLQCLMVPNERPKVGKQVQWMSQKRCRRVCLNVSSLQRCNHLRLVKRFPFIFIIIQRWTASFGIWIGHLKRLASSSYLISNTQKVDADVFFSVGRKRKISLHIYFHRKKGLLAFFCACSWRGCRETLWLPSMSRSSD